MYPPRLFTTKDMEALQREKAELAEKEKRLLEKEAGLVEDLKVVPIYLATEDMLADLGTKPLEPKLFISLRDRAFGYVRSFFF